MSRFKAGHRVRAARQKGSRANTAETRATIPRSEQATAPAPFVNRNRRDSLAANAGSQTR
ncbi:MAG: hypothetical protein KA178_08205 [Alphaproteobacteria bacterium]|nr:hypothetical protein [Alphaproteobacteria bacterium]MBP7761855.1 hypothetical protein [Alphaproteobacteria bacterium]